MERVADHIGIISEGRLKIQEPLEELKKSMKWIKLIFTDDIPASLKLELPGILKKEISGREILLIVKDYTPDLSEQFKQFNPAAIEVNDLNLDDIFVALEG
ncbi:MAG: hypothetical protein A2161_00400 [Candidatus Schekmanbacteria bacterium RBG_13_48_7]|uniref:DUF4162 domain-containing protein n=1 Tax=Candidatus Schekmanbacteria bacterium RBG_13_48_7 TaxID=1817878 RepID=A0A1F7S7I6_9BACT|nr:MAG: hypothetical protein A2161_00400 [Candidatus Schekmanbacteria bacterium RBG_13_48_7]